MMVTIKINFICILIAFCFNINKQKSLILAKIILLLNNEVWNLKNN